MRSSYDCSIYKSRNCVFDFFFVGFMSVVMKQIHTHGKMSLKNHLWRWNSAISVVTKKIFLEKSLMVMKFLYKRWACLWFTLAKRRQTHKEFYEHWPFVCYLVLFICWCLLNEMKFRNNSNLLAHANIRFLSDRTMQFLNKEWNEWATNHLLKLIVCGDSKWARVSFMKRFRFIVTSHLRMTWSSIYFFLQKNVHQLIFIRDFPLSVLSSSNYLFELLVWV